MSRAQVSLEMVIAISFVILIFMGFLVFYIQKNADLSNSQVLLLLREDCFRVSNALENAITLGDKTTIKLKLSSSVIISNGVVIVKNYNKTIACNYRGNVINTNFTGLVNIINQNGNIVIQNG